MSEASPRVIALLGGTGKEGSALARRWTRAGYDVVIGSRDADKAGRLCAELNGPLPAARASFAGYAEAAESADVVVLTVPFAVQRALVESIRPALAGKILIDATVPLMPPKVARVQLPAGGSAVLAIQELLGEGTRVVSAFQNVSAHVIDDPDHPVDCDVLVCGDDPAARETVIALAAAIGMRGLHAGPLCNSAAAEALTSVLISINSRYKVSGSGIRITGLDSLALGEVP